MYKILSENAYMIFIYRTIENTLIDIVSGDRCGQAMALYCNIFEKCAGVSEILSLPLGYVFAEDASNQYDIKGKSTVNLETGVYIAETII